MAASSNPLADPNPLKRKNPSKDTEFSFAAAPESKDSFSAFKGSAPTYVSGIKFPFQIMEGLILQSKETQQIIEYAFYSFGFLCEKAEKYNNRNKLHEECRKMSERYPKPEHIAAVTYYNELSTILDLDHKTIFEEKKLEGYPKYKQLLMSTAASMTYGFFHFNEEATSQLKLTLETAKNLVSHLSKGMPSELTSDEVPTHIVLKELIQITQLAIADIESGYQRLRQLRNLQLCMFYLFCNATFFPNSITSQETNPIFQSVCDSFRVPEMLKQAIENADDKLKQSIAEKTYFTRIHILMTQLRREFKIVFESLNQSYRSLMNVIDNAEEAIKVNSLQPRQEEVKEPAPKKVRAENSSQFHIGTYIPLIAPRFKADNQFDPTDCYQYLKTHFIKPFLIQIKQERDSQIQVNNGAGSGTGLNLGLESGSSEDVDMPQAKVADVLPVASQMPLVPQPASMAVNSQFFPEPGPKPLSGMSATVMSEQKIPATLGAPLPNLIWINNKEFDIYVVQAKTQLEEKCRNPIGVISYLLHAQAPPPFENKKLFTPISSIASECWWNNILVSIKNIEGQMVLDLIDEKTKHSILVIKPQSDDTLHIEKFKSTNFSSSQIKIIIGKIQNLLCAKERSPDLAAAGPVLMDGSDSQNESFAPIPEFERKDAKERTAPERLADTAPLVLEKPLVFIPKLSHDEFLKKITACSEKTLATWIPTFFGAPYKVVKSTYVWHPFDVEIPNQKQPSKPFQVRLQLNTFDHFIPQKRPGDKKGQSWVFGSEEGVTAFIPSYVPKAKMGDLPRFFVVRGWQVRNSGDKVKANENEILRAWFTHCGQIAEMKDVHRGSVEENPIPGMCVLELHHNLFSLFKPKQIVFADASTKKKNLLTRVWNAIKTSETYYQAQKVFATGPYPLRVSLFEHRQLFNKDQHAEIYNYSLKQIQTFSLTKFYEILNSKQRTKLIEIYKTCFDVKVDDEKAAAGPKGKGKSQGKNRSEAPYQTNPFAMVFDSSNYFYNNNITMDLQHLLQGIDAYIAKNPDCNYDEKLQEFICDGIDLRAENSVTDRFKIKAGQNFLSAQFAMWVYEIVWGGYYWQLSPMERAKHPKDEKDTISVLGL